MEFTTGLVCSRPLVQEIVMITAKKKRRTVSLIQFYPCIEPILKTLIYQILRENKLCWRINDKKSSVQMIHVYSIQQQE